MSALARGANVALTREIPTLRHLVVGLRWDASTEPVLDASVVGATLLCDRDSQLLSPEHFVFFNQLVSPDLTVAQRDEAAGGDREQVEVDLPDVPADVQSLLFVLYVNEGSGAKRTLGQLRSCSVRLINVDGDVELIRSVDLASELSTETALVVGDLYRHPSGWKFRVVGQGYDTGLRGVARDHGLTL